MNTIGKSFIFLICVLSLFFMAFSILVYSSQENWKDKYKKLNDELSQKKNESQRLATLQEDLKKRCDEQLKDKVDTVLKLQAHLDGNAKRYEEEKKTLAELHNDTLQQFQKMQANHGGDEQSQGGMPSPSVADLQKKHDELRQEFRTLQKEWSDLFSDFVKKTDESHDLEMKLNNIEQVERELVKQKMALTQ